MNRFRIFGTLAIAVLFAGVTLLAPGSADAKALWSNLGSRKVSFKKDKDIIPVTVKAGTFNAIKVKVSGGAIEMRDIRITFGNGSSYSPKVRAIFKKKSGSRVIDLPGDARVIRKVEFKYSRLGKRGNNAKVTLYGRLANPKKMVVATPKAGSPVPIHRQGQIAGPKPVTPSPVHQQGHIGGTKAAPAGPKPVKVKVAPSIGKKVITVKPAPKPVKVKVAPGIGKKVIAVKPAPKPVVVKANVGKKVVMVTPPKPHGTRAGPTAAVATAPVKGWVRLGSRKATFKAERDVINVGAKKGLFRAVDLRVKGSPLEMYNVRITFGNGATFEPKVRHNFKQGSWTRRIDLPGGKRNIQRIEFFYRSIGAKSGKADVVLYGQH